MYVHEKFSKSEVLACGIYMKQFRILPQSKTMIPVTINSTFREILVITAHSRNMWKTIEHIVTALP